MDNRPSFPLESLKRKREARKQAAEEDVFDYAHSGLYNIWYDRVQDYSTWKDRRDAKLAGKRFKLDVQKDPGQTAARGNAYLCLYFARGKCIQGKDCTYYHRIPTAEDEHRIDMLHDIFGRDRHKTDREDMGGVGSFVTNNTSLYVGGIKLGAGAEEMLFKAFSQFGTITYLRILGSKGIAFIQYKYRVSAEFAKEAMADQSIVGNEVLNVRWASDHPNQQVERQKEDKMQIEAWKKMKEKFPSYFSQYQSLLEEEYPDTDEQYTHMPAITLPQDAEIDKTEEAEKALAAVHDGNYEGEQAIEDTGGQWGEDQMGKYFYWPDADEPVKLTPLERAEREREKQALAQQKEQERQQKEKFLAEVTNYMAWQKYYAENNYPGYWNEYGVYHYYDPALYPEGMANQNPDVPPEENDAPLNPQEKNQENSEKPKQDEKETEK